MHNTHRPAYFSTSLGAGAIALAPLLLLGIIGGATEGDDASLRGAGVLFATIPLLYLPCVLASLVLGKLFVEIGLVGLRQFMGASVVTSLIFAAGVGLYDAANAPVSAAIRTTAIASVFFMVSAVPAAYWWWRQAVKPNHQALRE